MPNWHANFKHVKSAHLTETCSNTLCLGSWLDPVHTCCASMSHWVAQDWLPVKSALHCAYRKIWAFVLDAGSEKCTSSPVPGPQPIINVQSAAWSPLDCKHLTRSPLTPESWNRKRKCQSDDITGWGGRGTVSVTVRWSCPCPLLRNALYSPPESMKLPSCCSFQHTHKERQEVRAPFLFAHVL